MLGVLGFNLTTIFIIGMLITFYIAYVSPWLRTINDFKKDSQLNGHLGIVLTCKDFDNQNINKAFKHLRRFLYYYSQTYLNTEDHKVSSVHKMKVHQQHCMKYFRRVPFKLQNDANLTHAVEQAIENINIILENYTHEASDRNNMHYFDSHY